MKLFFTSMAMDFLFFSSDEVHMMPGNFTPVSLLAVLALLHGNKLRVIPGLFEHS